MHNKRYTLLLVAITYVITAIAQPVIKDQRTIGGNNNDNFTTMSRTRDGGLIVGGYSISNRSYQKSGNSRGEQDYWIVKLDSNHKIQWDKTIGGSGTDELFAVQQTTDGGYILGGQSSSGKSGEKTGKKIGGTDYWIVKLDSNHKIQWDKTIGGNSYDYLKAIQQTTDGGYILGGWSVSNISGNKTENHKGAYDYWIVKLNADGNVLWDKTIGGDKIDFLYSIQPTRDGGYILGGKSGSNKSGDKTENSKGGPDYWIVKIDSTGNIQWDKTIGGKGNEDLFTVQQTFDGGYILGGSSESNQSGDKTENVSGYRDYWVVKTNSIGSIQWDNTIGGNYIDNLYDLQQTADSGYILCGDSQSNISGDKTENWRSSDGDYWIVKINSQGKVEWDKTIGGGAQDGYLTTRIREIKKNDYLIGGASASGVDGDKTGFCRGGFDYWLVELKYIKEHAIAVKQNKADWPVAPQQNSTTAFYMYPNPATTILHIQNKGRATFILTSSSGKAILTKTFNDNGDISVANIPAGTYYLTNTTTGVTQKLVITR